MSPSPWPVCRITVAVLDGGTVDDAADHQPERVGDDVALAPLHLLARVIVPDAAVGCTSRPSGSRVSMAKVKRIVWSSPPSRQL